MRDEATAKVVAGAEAERVYVRRVAVLCLRSYVAKSSAGTVAFMGSRDSIRSPVRGVGMGVQMTRYHYARSLLAWQLRLYSRIALGIVIGGTLGAVYWAGRLVLE